MLGAGGRQPAKSYNTMEKIVFATANSHKVREAAEILGPGFEIVTAAQAGITEEIPETGETLGENSLQKALYLWERLGCDCFADDTGLEVDALGGAPGVYSARYAGPEHSFSANMEKLLREMEGATDRRARFRTVVTLIIGGERHVFEGQVCGRISEQETGNGGFGYDPIFVPDEFPLPDGTIVPNDRGLSFSEMTDGQKNAISHRGRALRAMALWLGSRTK